MGQIDRAGQGQWEAKKPTVEEGEHMKEGKA